MSNLKYQIVHCEVFEAALKYNKQHLKQKQNNQTQGKKMPKQRGATNASINQYIDHAVQFGAWCKKNYNCRNFEECRQYIQAYAQSLEAKKLSASTIHTYLAGVCRAWSVSMDTIEKPIRHAAKNTRSRGDKAVDKRSDAKRERSPAFYDFCVAVGIRRSEASRLKGNDCMVDESGYLCVLVRKGKGGKRQLQRVALGREAFVKRFFDGSDHYIFSKQEIKNKIDVHHLRHLAAATAYQGFLSALQAEPAYRTRLIAEIKARWSKYNVEPWNQHQVEGYYYTRGENRTHAIAMGLPLKYDRLALMATSVFHLAHWRNNVTVNNYLLAISGEEYQHILAYFS